MKSKMLSMAVAVIVLTLALVLSFSSISVVNMAKKNRLLAARTALCAEKFWPSTVKLTSHNIPECRCVFSTFKIMLSSPFN